MRDWDEFDHEGFERRIKTILGERDEQLVSEKSLLKYRKYLQARLTMPCTLTGIEDFLWEEFYVLGPGSKKEYEELKKTQPSYTDEFELIEFEDKLDSRDGIIVNVRRITDGKKFILPLGDLKVVDDSSDNYQLVDDYAIWIVNY